MSLCLRAARRAAPRVPALLGASRVLSLGGISCQTTTTPPPQLPRPRTFGHPRRYSMASSLDDGKPGARGVLDTTSLGAKAMRLPVLHHELNYIWLRENCRCEACYNHATHQKIIMPHHVEADIRPMRAALHGDDLEVIWRDGHASSYSIPWVQQHYFPPAKQKTEQYLWDNKLLSINDVPRVNFTDFMTEDEALKLMLTSLLKFGFALVDGVPADEPSTEKACRRVCHVEPTLYGEMYSFTSNQAMDDTAYTSQAIGPHTDSTYFSLPMGIQVLHCTYHDGEGGNSLLLDGFHVAEQLRTHSPDLFDTLTRVMVPHEYKATVKSRHHVASLDTILKTHPITKELLWIRYNNYDRAPVNSIHPDDLPEFYAAINGLSRLVENPKQEMWFKLNPGTVLFMDNFRVMHGRSAFTGNRCVTGCYLPRDDWMSRARVAGLL